MEKKVYVQLKVGLVIPVNSDNAMEAILLAKLMAENGAKNMLGYKECKAGKAWVINNGKD